MVWGADKPFMNKLAIRRWKARFPFWPPPDASPVTPIEPWGKQFFVYNAPKGTEIRGDPRAPSQDELRPAWLRDEDAASMLGEAVADIGGKEKHQPLAARRATLAKIKPGPETLLCATDFRQRPMLFLRPEEWFSLLQELPELREKLRQKQAEIDAMDERGAHMEDYFLRRKYIVDKYAERRIGVPGYGGINRSLFSSGEGLRARERKIRLANRVLEEISNSGAAE
ncbi:unnamed protein product [Durusdinium trenchii]|uniref:Uncharacterized protein n=2 Tax=Durusdinium trenchii TaxID=1381693 RepID=A0ABP0NFT7_9DINO